MIKQIWFIRVKVKLTQKRTNSCNKAEPRQSHQRKKDNGRATSTFLESLDDVAFCRTGNWEMGIINTAITTAIWALQEQWPNEI